MGMNTFMLTPRLNFIIKTLLAQSEPISATMLAKTTQISKRTLFREIRGCNSILKSYGLHLETKTGLGLWIVGSNDAKDTLRKVLSAQKSLHINKVQRQSLLIAELLKSKELVKINNFSTLFDVSEGTISNDIDDLDAWFKRYNLTIERKPGVGVHLKGSEDDVRKAMTDFVHTQLDEKNDWAFVLHANTSEALELYFESNEESSILNLLNKVILKKVIQALKHHANDILIMYAQSSTIGLIIHLTIAIERLTKQEVISVAPTILDQIKDDEDYALAQRISRIMELEFNTPVPQAETAYILMHLKGAKRRVLDQSAQSLDNLSKDEHILSIATILITQFEAVSGYILVDEHLHIGLITHLRPTLTRLYYKLEIRNPLLEKIKTNYAQVFDWTKQAVEPLERELNIILPDDEIGYLAIHFGAAIERAKLNISENTTIRVGVVCASGIGISSLLSTRIMNLFPQLKSVVPLSVDDMSHMLDVDLLISTLDLKHLGRDFVFVHPLLLDEDIQNIQHAIQLIKPKVKHTAVNVVTHDPLSMIQSTVLHALAQLTITKLHPLNEKAAFIRTICNCLYEVEELQVMAFQDLMRRESIGSIILHESGVMLLHAKTKATKLFEFKIFQVQTPLSFILEAEIKTIIVMLIQEKPHSVQTSLLSMINQSLIDDEQFMLDIQSQSELRIRESIQRLCQTWLTTQTKQHIRG